MNSFSSGKNRSYLKRGQRIWSQVSPSTGCHPKFRLWTTPSPTVFAIRVRIARQMAGWKTRNNNSSTTVSERWRNAGLSAFQLQVSMLKSDKIWCAYLVVNCVSLRTFWTPLVYVASTMVTFLAAQYRHRFASTNFYCWVTWYVWTTCPESLEQQITQRWTCPTSYQLHHHVTSSHRQ